MVNLRDTFLNSIFNTYSIFKYEYVCTGSVIIHQETVILELLKQKILRGGVLIVLSYALYRTLIVLLLVHYEWYQHVNRSKSPSFSILTAYFLPLSTKSHIPSSLRAFTASPRFLSRKKGSACQSKIRLLSPPPL